jgi:hypothetical protein
MPCHWPPVRPPARAGTLLHICHLSGLGQSANWSNITDAWQTDPMLVRLFFLSYLTTRLSTVLPSLRFLNLNSYQ